MLHQAVAAALGRGLGEDALLHALCYASWADPGQDVFKIYHTRPTECRVTL